MLAGFVVGPSAQQVAQRFSGGQSFTDLRLLAISIACSGVGAIGLIGLWIRWKSNYLWLVHKIFFPGFLNGLAGTLSAAVNIWAMQKGAFHFNEYTTVTISITGGATVICFALTLVYELPVLSVKHQHQKETRDENNLEARGWERPA
ncbi:hypothetical protein FRC08_015487 [Ceratobasidium sp. 394]|nr:hypothetical protein FRC08_015487 [Ceratobasidium sp. 394]